MAYENRHEFMDGKIVLYTRNENPTFHARIRIDGLENYIVKSTKRTNLAEAKAVAETFYNDYWYRFRNGLEVGTNTFSTLYRRWLEANKVGLSHHRLTYIDGTANRYFLPYFGKFSLAQITDALVEKYWDWRRNYWVSAAGAQKIEAARKARPTTLHPHKSRLGNVAKIPAAKTLQMEQTVLRQVFAWAIRTGQMTRMPHVKVPLQKKHGVSRRPAFEEEDWKALYRYLRSWAGDDKQEDKSKPDYQPLHSHAMSNGIHIYHRHLLRNYVLFMQASGLRPNEARQLRWRDLKIKKDRKGVDQLHINIAPTTKTGERTCVALHNAIEIVARMKEQNGCTEPDDFVFSDRDGRPVENFGKTFKAVLEASGLLTDSFGQVRTIYSLRHTYATFRIANSDISLHDLAKNMGTSPTTLFNHYSHVTATQKAHIHGGNLNKEKSRKGWYL